LENRLYYPYITLAQVGYLHWYGCQSGISGSGGTCSDGKAHVFVEWTDNAGTYSPVYYFGTPSTVEDFEVQRVNQNSFKFYWNEGTYTSGTASWGPDSEVAKTEVHDYTASSSGSHGVGDTSNTVSVSGVTYLGSDNNNHYANFAYGSKSNPSFLQSTAYQALSSSDSSDFNVWDSRCSN
jgi:hypothetical protein